MSAGYEASVELLRQHGVNITRIVSQLDQALAAANAASVPEDAFGMICSEIGIGGWLVAPLQDRGVQAVTNAIARADEIRDLLAATGRAYDQQELLHANQFIDQSEQL